MTIKQSIVKFIYPVWMFIEKIKGNKGKILFNKADKQPPVSFYNLQSTLTDGNVFLFEQLKNKKVLIVNTASDCIYTSQYNELETLYKLYTDKLIILAFPSNDFKEQEKATDKNIATFCKLNFGISFPLMQKSIVIKNEHQNNVYQWLTDATKNGWNTTAPKWNFSKYLINETGVLTHYFESGISPVSDEIKDVIATHSL